RGRTGMDLLEQLRIIGNAPLQFRQHTMARMNERDLAGIARDGAALPVVELVCRKRKGVTVAFEKRHGRDGTIRRDQKIDVMGVLDLERAISKLRQRHAL